MVFIEEVEKLGLLRAGARELPVCMLEMVLSRSFFSGSLYLFFIGKLHTNPKGFEPTTSPTTHSYGRKNSI
jgi:hypothetical protein